MSPRNYAPDFRMRIALFFFLLANASAGTFHVSQTGDDTAAGTKDAPWRTIQRAVDAEPARTGKIIEVGPGAYQGPVNIRSGGPWRDPLIVRGAAGAAIEMSDAEDAVVIDSDSPVIFEGFRIRTMGGVGVRVSGSSHGIDMAPPTDPNTAIAWHIYAGKEENDEKRWATAFGKIEQSLPVIVTEWGFDENGIPPYRGGVPDFGEKFARNWLVGRDLHWVAWSWHPNVAPPLIKSDWKTPTSFGNFVGVLLRANPRVRHSPPAAFSPTGQPSAHYRPFSIN